MFYDVLLGIEIWLAMGSSLYLTTFM